MRLINRFGSLPCMILSVLFFFFQANAKSFSQLITFSGNAVGLEKVFDAIEAQSDYVVFYDYKQIQDAHKITINVRQVTVEEFLKKCFENQPLKYVIEKNTILVTRSADGNTFAAQAVQVREEVTGRVTNAAGEPLAGVSVTIKGTGTGTATAGNGTFSLNVTAGQVLVFTYVGFITQEHSIARGNETINIRMAEADNDLNDVVVIGYGKAKKKDLTGAVSSVSAAQIEKVPVTTLEQSLQGLSAGVLVTSNDGAPGSSVSVKIRGTGTFGDNTPLYVVDGYPISGDLSSLNPSDIASMDVLKDASATAIYGSRASNGVVIITTKRGRKEGLQVSIDGRASVQAKPKVYKVLTAEQFVMAAREVNATENYPLLPEWQGDISGLRNIDWQDAFYRPGFRQNYNVTLRGGNEKLQSAFSLGYFGQTGIVRFSDFQRQNASFNLDYTPAKWIRSGVNFKYTHGNKQLVMGSGINHLENLTTNIPTMTGNPVTDQIKDENGNYGSYDIGPLATSTMKNIYADAEQQEQKNPFNYLLSSAYVEISVAKGLKLKTNFGVNNMEYAGYSFSPSNERTLPAPLAAYSQYSRNTFEWLWENTVSYNRVFGAHDIDFVGGISSQKNTLRQLEAGGTGLVSNDLRNIGSLSTIIATGNQQTWALESQFARLTYKLLEKYIVTGTIRRDGSSRFRAGHQYGVFPSISAAWRLSDEGFLNNSKAISDLKIRGSWGQSGNQNIGLFQYLATFGPGPSIRDNRGYVFGADKVYQSGLVLNQLVDPDLTWESTTQYDAGIDAGLFNNRIVLTADYYHRESSGFLLSIPVPSQTGFTRATRNVGSITNSGIELALQYRQAQGVFKWNVTANVTTVNNKINSFTEGLTSIGNFSDLNFRNFGGNVWTTFSRSAVGGEVGAFYGFKSDGIFQTQAEIDALNAAAASKFGSGSFYQVSRTAPGDRKFMDLNNDGRVTDDDRTIIGSPIPDYFGGITFDGSFRQFDFSIFWYASVGNEIINYAKRNLQNFDLDAGVGIQNLGEEFYLNHWTADKPSTVYPRLVAIDNNGNNRISDAFVEDGSFLRLKNVQVGYALPGAFTKRLRMAGARVYVSAQNLVTFTKYTGLDPEIGEAAGVTANGLDIGTYPISRYFAVGFNLNFN